MAERASRDSTLDFARALALIGMVVGHSLHAVLTNEARSTGFIGVYWRTRAITGPLFLLLAGWVLVLAMRRVSDGPLFSRPIVTRLVVLIAAGTILNWPCGEGPLLLQGDSASWTRLLAFGPLHCVAVCSVVGLIAMTVVRSPWGRFSVFAFATVLCVVASSWLSPSSGTFAQLLAGPHSQYPLLPWGGFFFAGCMLALSLPAAKAPFRRRILLLLALSLIAISGQIDPLQFSVERWFNFMLRLGITLAVVCATQFTPERFASFFAPLGRLSLWVYVIHLPIVYGFHEFSGLSGMIGRTLPGGIGALVALGVLVFSIVAAVVLRGLWARALEWVKPVVGAAPGGLRLGSGRAGSA